MTTTTKHETEIAAAKDLPTITITREFDAPRELVFRAWTDPELLVQWLGPKASQLRVTQWDCRTGGSWAYVDGREGDPDYAAFYGSFHEIREPSRLVQTFTWAGAPDGVSLETLTLEELPGGRTRSVIRSVVESFEIRDAMLSSGMDVGIIEGFEKLDALLGTSPA
ncbi:SRPBCC family protein [Nocardioides sp. CER19]|uniref:SRPBCC family protein n=1 Tax=Nocardioides sp. CER19 TaxID=3038538 RepID=UPI00244864FF|nr:SRPBCC family protein [Nocardioides sp. CER19]MDH2414277.1 SRPBCC family protein [Nocardioides sp. CER19]